MSLPPQSPSKGMESLAIHPSDPPEPRNEQVLIDKYKKVKPPTEDALQVAKLRDKNHMPVSPVTPYSPIEMSPRVTSQGSIFGVLDEREAALKRRISQLLTPSAEFNVVADYLASRLALVRVHEERASHYRETLRRLCRSDEKLVEPAEYLNLLGDLDVRCTLFRREKFALLSKRRKISEYILATEESSIDRAYADALSHTMGTVHNATYPVSCKRSTAVQEQFSKSVMLQYDAYNDDTKQQKWCCITGGCFSGKEIVAAHIVPRKVEGKLALAAMGKADVLEDSSDIIWKWNNGLPMLKAVEMAYDAGRFVIVPFNNETDPASLLRFKVIVLDTTLLPETILTNGIGERNTWAEINGAEVRFRHATNRPAKRNLFFHYVTTLLRRQYYEPPDWWKDADAISDVRTVWATPGKWYRRSTLQHMIRLVGQVHPDGPLRDFTGSWADEVTYDEDYRLPEDEDEDPSTAEERTAGQLFDEVVTRPDTVAVEEDGDDVEEEEWGGIQD